MKVSYEEYCSRLNIKFPSLIAISKDKSSPCKIHVKCSICGHCYTFDMNTLKRKQYACRECYAKTTRKQSEKFLEEMFAKNPNIEVCSEYVKSNKKVHCKCRIDGYEWDTTPNDLLCGKGCPRCSGNLGLSASEMNSFFCENGIAAISLQEGYIASKKKSWFKCICDGCGYKWEDYFNNIKRRMWGCPKCNGALPTISSHIEYIDALAKINPDVVPLEQFKSITTYLLHVCNRHSYTWKIDPSHTLRGQGCRYCKLEKIGNGRRLDVSEYIGRLSISSPTVELYGEYINGHKQTTHRCKECGHIWNPFPINLLKGGGCPICKSSRGEKQVVRVMDSLNLEYVRQYRIKDCRDKYPLPFDFYIPSINLLIEYQGEQHYIPCSFSHDCDKETMENNLKDLNRRDSIKRTYCKDHSLPLLEIPYWEYDNIELIVRNAIEQDCLDGESFSCTQTSA